MGTGLTILRPSRLCCSADQCQCRSFLSPLWRESPRVTRIRVVQLRTVDALELDLVHD